MLPDQDNDMAEVCEAFGYAAFWACLWEMELVALAGTIYRIKNPKATRMELDQYDANLRKKPVGQWTKQELKDFLSANPDSTEFIQKVTRARNKLIHHFFEEQITNLNSETGRKFALKELELLAKMLKLGQKTVKEAYMNLAKRHFKDIDQVLADARKRVEKNWKD